jgi:hypothetical protein
MLQRFANRNDQGKEISPRVAAGRESQEPAEGLLQRRSMSDRITFNPPIRSDLAERKGNSVMVALDKQKTGVKPALACHDSDFAKRVLGALGACSSLKAWEIGCRESPRSAQNRFPIPWMKARCLSIRSDLR